MKWLTKCFDLDLLFLVNPEGGLEFQVVLSKLISCDDLTEDDLRRLNRDVKFHLLEGE